MPQIKQTIDLPGGSGRVVLFEESVKLDVKRDMIPDKNLVCYELDGRERWRAKLPRDASYFVSVQLDGDLITANVDTSYLLWLDPETGITLKEVFTK